MGSQKQRLVAEICHPSSPFCPWARRPAPGETSHDRKITYALHPLGRADKANPLSEGITYMGFDIRALPTHSLGDDEQPSLRHRRKSGIRRQGDALALSLHKASVSEFYLSLVATNPYIYPWVLPALVREAHRILRAEGLLVFFNGYPRSQHSVVVDFTDGRTHLLCSHASRKQSYCSETVGLLGDLFKALTLEEHKLFLAERGLTGAYELEPGKEVSVLVRKTLTR